MKERNFFDDDFDDLLREKSDQFKMYPSDKVWKEIYGSLHTGKRRFVAGMSILISTVLILAGKQLLAPSNSTVLAAAAKSNNLPAAPVIDLQAFIANTNKKSLPSSSRSIIRKLSAPYESVQEDDEIADAIHPATTQPVLPVNPAAEITHKTIPVYLAPTNQVTETIGKDLAMVAPFKMEPVTAEEKQLSPLNNSSAVANSIDAMQQRHTLVHNDRLSWQLYITPSLSYRKLTGVDYAQTGPAISPISVVQVTNVNSFSSHTPALGFEFGGALLYKLSRNLSLKAGLQFNYGHYAINAYHSASGQSAAILNSYFGYVADSLASSSSTGFSNPKDRQQLQNKYYELSVPLGLEMKVAGRNRLQLHVGVNIQPTYLLNNNGYVLSADANQYDKEATAFRRWNVDGGAEVFISYRIGSLRWQLGPQLRYQLLSTYKNSYPFKEGLTQYGIKIGFTKTIW